jgi:DNA-directed RNA polymerase specialized sigma subunit
MQYVKNKDLREELIKSKIQDKLTSECLNMFILMANNFSNKFKYYYKEDKEDCISFAIMDCFRYWRGYNPEKSVNAFAYITQIIKNGLAKGWRQLSGNFPKKNKISLSTNNIWNI